MVVLICGSVDGGACAKCELVMFLYSLNYFYIRSMLANWLSHHILSLAVFDVLCVEFNNDVISTTNKNKKTVCVSYGIYSASLIALYPWRPLRSITPLLQSYYIFKSLAPCNLAVPSRETTHRRSVMAVNMWTHNSLLRMCDAHFSFLISYVTICAAMITHPSQLSLILP